MKCKSPTLFVLIFLMLFSSISCVSAITGAIGNAKMVLYPEVGIGGVTIERTILVKNVNNVSVNITVEPSENLEGIVKVLDNEFVLGPNQDKKARIQIKVRKVEDVEGTVDVFFNPVTEEGAGVALSSTIIIRPSKKGIWDNNDIGDEVDKNISLGNIFNIEDGNKNASIVLLLVSSLGLTIVLIYFIYILNKRTQLNPKKNKGDKHEK